MCQSQFPEGHWNGMKVTLSSVPPKCMLRHSSSTPRFPKTRTYLVSDILCSHAPLSRNLFWYPYVSTPLCFDTPLFRPLYVSTPYIHSNTPMFPNPMFWHSNVLIHVAPWSDSPMFRYPQVLTPLNFGHLMFRHPMFRHSYGPTHYVLTTLCSYKLCFDSHMFLTPLCSYIPMFLQTHYVPPFLCYDTLMF